MLVACTPSALLWQALGGKGAIAWTCRKVSPKVVSVPRWCVVFPASLWLHQIGSGGVSLAWWIVGRLDDSWGSRWCVWCCIPSAFALALLQAPDVVWCCIRYSWRVYNKWDFVPKFWVQTIFFIDKVVLLPASLWLHQIGSGGVSLAWWIVGRLDDSWGSRGVLNMCEIGKNQCISNVEYKLICYLVILFLCN